MALIKNLDKNQLENLYLVQKLTVAQIADKFNISKCCVLNNFKRYNIKCRSKVKNLKGLVFGRLTVIQQSGLKNRRIMWKCQCSCGNFSHHQSDVLSSGKVKKCLLCRREKYIGEISGRFFCKIRSGAIKRNIEFSITQQFIWELYLKQNRKCALSGEEIKFGYDYKDSYTASLDRIDSSKGYIESNIQWIHKEIQSMKMNKNEKIFIGWCKKIANNNG